MEDDSRIILSGVITDYSLWDDTINDGNIETIETSDEPYNGLSHFVAEDYELECCLDNDLHESSFTLIFDEAPDFDGEPVEKTDEPEMIYQYRKIA
jgi:hypothetical protein